MNDLLLILLIGHLLAAMAIADRFMKKQPALQKFGWLSAFFSGLLLVSLMSTLLAAITALWLGILD